MSSDRTQPRTMAARRLLSHAEAPEHAAMAVAAASWLLVLMPRSGGFRDPSLAVAAVALAPALFVVQPWQRLARLLCLAAGAAAVAALVTLTVKEPFWLRADEPAAVLYGVLVLLLTSAYCRTSARRAAVVIALLIAVPLQMLPAWNAWLGSGDPNHVMVGTFFWHNQFGTFMAAVGVVAAAIGIAGRGLARSAALVLAPVAYAGTVLSTSRTSLFLLVGAHLVLLVLTRGRTGAVPALARWASVPAAAALFLLVITSGLFFDRPWDGPPVLNSTETASIAGDRSSQSLTDHGNDRLLWTDAALRGWTHSPVLGRGFGSFPKTLAELHPEATSTAFVHNAYAEALTSGGLLFGVPLAIILAFVVVAVWRAWWSAVRGAQPERATCAGAAVASGLLLVHAGVDFDWHYGAVVGLLGVTAGLVMAHREDAPVITRTPDSPWPLAAVLVACAFVIVATGVSEWLQTSRSDSAATAPVGAGSGRTPQGLADATGS